MERRSKTTMLAGPPPFRPSIDYLFAVALSWLIPGAGHWILGDRVRAVVLGSMLLGTFWWGEAMAGGYAVIRKEHPYFFYGQIGIGLSAIVADRLTPWADVDPEPDAPRAFGGNPIDRKPPRGLAVGILLTSIAGLLNIVQILHVMDPRTWMARAARPAPRKAE